MAIVTAVSLGSAELFLRVTYSDGLSFGSHYGPLVVRFERDMRFNRYDGPSRGPEVAGAKDADIRILIQGDSVTWGQGVKPESALYSSLLRDRLRADNPRFEVAALARPGREIDDHLAQLRKWGEEIAPDAIVYQWYVNDLELDKSRRPGRDRSWRSWLFPNLIKGQSYLWFMLDYRINAALPTTPSYEDYLYQDFRPGTEGWRRFAEQYHAWAVEAKRLTPHVLVALYPHLLPTPDRSLADFRSWMRKLSAQEGIEVIDLAEPLEVYRDDFTQTYASPFDAHPNAAVHARIAEALYQRMHETWPALFHLAPDPGTSDHGHV